MAGRSVLEVLDTSLEVTSLPSFARPIMSNRLQEHISWLWMATKRCSMTRWSQSGPHPTTAIGVATWPLSLS